jgi:hypothetical protein
LALGDDRVLVAWEDERAETLDIYARFLSDDGPEGEEILIAGERGEQWLPALAWGGDSFLVVYLDQASPHGVYAVTLNEGSPSEPVAVLPEIEPTAPPRLVALEEGYALFYRVPEGLESHAFLLALAEDGTPAGEPVEVDDMARGFDVILDSEELYFLAVRTDFSTAQLTLRRLALDGTPSADPMVLACAANITSPALVRLGEGLAISWSQTDPDPLIPSRMYATLLEL